MTRVRVRDETSEFERNVKQVTDSLSNSIFVDGVLLEDVALTTSPTRIFHKLNRPIRGLFVVYATDDTRVFVNGTNNQQFVELAANATRTVNLWLF